MNHTLFFVLGISLVAAAVLVAAVGLRSERFPASKGLLVGATALFATLVVATGAFAWLNAEDEQDAREAELASATEENAAAGNEGQAAEEVGSQVEGEASPASVDGAAVFESAGCSGCHTLAAAGSTATTGPVLDDVLKGKDEAFIETSIVDPSANVEKGFPDGVMPTTYGDQLSPEELSALVQYLVQSTSGGSSETTVPAAGGQELTIKMGEFYYKPSDVTAKAGSVTITAPNEGGAPHELVVAKTNDDPAKLPTVADGSVDEAQLDIPGEVSEVEAGTTGTATLDLSAGKYVMFCNLPGHYKGGMYGSLTVN